jgi:hypothetical protein
MTKRTCIFLACAAAAFAQSRISHVPVGGQTGPVTGRPLDATEVRHSIQVLSDGTKLENSSSSRFYRDSAGRMRIESPERAEIYDPVAGVMYDLDAQHQTYRKTSTDAKSVMIAVDGGWSGTSRSSDPPRSDRPSHVDLGIPYQKDKQAVTTKEDLPPQTINGIAARGSRVTSTIPAGVVGNDRDFKIVSERWYSDDLQVLLKTSTTDPRFGTDTYELTNIKQTQPDPALFLPPQGYTERTGH